MICFYFSMCSFLPDNQCQDQIRSTLDMVLSDDEHSVTKSVVTDSLGSPYG